MRNITLYWTPVPKKYSNTLNHEKFHYIIEMVSHDIMNGTSQIVRFDQSHFTFSNLSIRFAYNFRIYSTNDYGRSLKFTEITIDKEEVLPLKPKYLEVLSYSQGHYELHWKGIANIDLYVVSWCLAEKTESNECVGPMRSEPMTIGFPKTLSNLTGSHYNFGISSIVAIKNENSRYNFVSSSITWASCVVPMRITKPSKLPFSLTSVDTNSFQLQWKLSSCPGLYVVISRFEIIYCHLTNKNESCREEKRILLNNSHAESYKLNGLHPDSLYRVTMRMWNMHNETGEESDYLEVRTATEIDFILPIIFGVIALTITAIMIIVCQKLFIKIKKDFKDIMRQKVQLPGSLGDSYNLTKTILSQTMENNSVNVFESNENEMELGSSISENCSVENTNLDFGLSQLKAYVTHEKLNEMSQCSQAFTRTNESSRLSKANLDSGLGQLKAYVTHERLNEMSQCPTFIATIYDDSDADIRLKPYVTHERLNEMSQFVKNFSSSDCQINVQVE